jgi:arylsulfatase B
MMTVVRLWATVILLVIASVSAQAAERPNVIFIVADDLGYGEVGCYGEKDIPTPQIDALAASGVKFTSGYVTAPFCAASRAGLMTGRYQTRFGFEFNPIGAKNAESGIGLPIQEKTIPDRLREAGYATGLVGKWHLGGTAPFHPQRRGFDEFFGFLHEGHYYVPPPWPGVTTWLRRQALPDGSQGRWTSPDGRIVWSTHMRHREPDYDADNPLLRNSQPVNEQSNLTDAFTREACDFIGRHRHQPFFLFLSYNAVHSPLQATDAKLKQFAHISDIHRRIFAAMLSHLDDSIGTVLAKVREAGLAERTLVVFLSDNGGPTKELTSSNLPLRGGKGELWEGGIRIPFVMSWPGTIPAGKASDVPVSSLDASATALQLAGIEMETLPLDGENLLPLLTGKSSTPPHDDLFWRVGKKQAVRHGNWKLVRERAGEWQLFDLATDIGETNDLAPQFPARARDLAARWEAWNAQQVAPLW